MESIPKEALEAARVRLCRKVAAAIVTAMADTGITFEQMDRRIELTPGTCKGWLLNFIEGKSNSIDNISDMMLSMGCELDWQIVGYREIPFRKPEQAEAA